MKGPLGGNVTVHCSYPKGNENVKKYFNKGKPETQLVRLEGRKMWLQDSRFSLKDDKEKREFTVTIRNLSVEDAGLYWCRVKKWVRDIQTEVNLNVVQAEVQDVTTENGEK